MSSRKLGEIILNPFEDVTSRNLLIVGTIGFLLMSLLAYFFHFINDGVFQLHLSKSREYWKCLVNGGINSLVLTLVMFTYGRLVYPKTRFQDVLIAVLIAQFSLIIIVLVTFNPYTMDVTHSIIGEIEKGNISNLKIATGSLIILTISGLFGILLLYYFFHLLVKGMKIAINSTKLVHTIVIVLITLVLDTLLRIVNPYL